MPALPLSHYLRRLLSLTGLSRNVYYFFDDLLTKSRGVVTVCRHGPIRPAHSILLASPPNPMAPEPLSTTPLALSLMDRWQTKKNIAVSSFSLNEHSRRDRRRGSVRETVEAHAIVREIQTHPRIEEESVRSMARAL